MTGATAATVAVATASQGGLIMINLTDNYISGLDNSLNADVTGDGHQDITLTGAKYLSLIYLFGDLLGLIKGSLLR